MNNSNECFTSIKNKNMEDINMSKVKCFLEFIYICAGLLFCSKQLMNDNSKSCHDVLEQCGISLN